MSEKIIEKREADLSLKNAYITNNGMGLEINDNISKDELLDIGTKLSTMEGAIQFWIGDWINVNWGKFEDNKLKLAESLGYEVSSLKTLARVSRDIPIYIRTNKLSWTHHEALASLISNDKLDIPRDTPIEELLIEWRDKAIQNKWNKNSLRRAIDISYGLRSDISLRERYGEVPFNVFDTTSGDWQKFNDIWYSLGIKSLSGRDENLLGLSDSDKEEIHYGDGGKKTIQESSKFDAHLTDIMYKWFCIENGCILDPFAGGSVRGLVANYLGYKYTGIELSEKQVTNNIRQSLDMNLNPNWIVGDSYLELDEIPDDIFDFIFTCPPYYDLEVYGEQEGELSNIGSYNKFIDRYSKIITKSVAKLRNNRFACIVVSNIRDKRTGFYRNLVSDTIIAFNNAGMELYNDAVLINAVGSLPIRVQMMFKGNRKLGPRFQNILIFYKGDTSKIKEVFGEQ